LRCRRSWWAVLILCLAATRALAQEAPAPEGETVRQALCRLIEDAAKRADLPVGFFTRLIWRESSFRLTAVSRAGAQGVAQFMPGTAAERGLADPFDPEQAIPASAAFLKELERRFGNRGLAAAAYNGGPGRVAGWLAGRDELRAETIAYVQFVTGLSAEEWAARARGEVKVQDEEPRLGCLEVVALLRRPGAPDVAFAQAALAPWGVQLAGNFSKDLALASYRRAGAGLAAVLGDTRPMIIGTRLRSRGTRPFYRVRVPAQTREAAEVLCGRIRERGGSCAVLRT